MNKRFEHNIPSISFEEQELLAKKHVLVAGCGGRGGSIIENLVRLGIGKITAADNASFEISDLNRQLLSTTDLIGTKKAFAARDRAIAINPEITFNIWTMKITEKNVDSALAGKDLVIDALDNVDDRLLLEDACAKAGITVIHGSVSGWRTQVMTVTPGSGSLADFYKNNTAPAAASQLSFTSAFCAAVQASEAVKVLCGTKSDLENKILIADLKTNEFKICDPDEKSTEEKSFTVTANIWGKAANDVTVSEYTTLQQLADMLKVSVDSAMVNEKPVKYINFGTTYLAENDKVTFIDYNSFARGG
ncbi:MAG: HesA/MoeB/ThiF family protein [Lachnospiraceae bacterium]|jgi:molybdopterin/thiamine biosynthesis adenylyltransferase